MEFDKLIYELGGLHIGHSRKGLMDTENKIEFTDNEIEVTVTSGWVTLRRDIPLSWVEGFQTVTKMYPMRDIVDLKGLQKIMIDFDTLTTKYPRNKLDE